MNLLEFIFRMIILLLIVLVIILVCLWTKYTEKEQVIREQDELIEYVLKTNQQLVKDNKKLCIKYKDLHSLHNDLLNAYWNLSDKKDELKRQLNTSQNSQEVKEAVKYAMKSAHPDNGGDAKDFMKFRELYNKIK